MLIDSADGSVSYLEDNMFFDTHAHLNDERFNEDRDELIASLPENGVDFTCEIGYDVESSRAAVELSKKYSFIYAAAGVHPHDVEGLCEDDMDKIRALLSEEKTVALGEIGLDYYYDNSPRDLQKKWFVRQLELAREADCPVTIHTRDAMEDTINILKAHGTGRGIIHCYSGSRESAKILLDLGYYISFAGPVTFKNANSVLEVVRYVPSDRLLIETDSPYLAPVPYRGKRNCPVYVAEVAEKIAEIRGMDLTELAALTTNNAKKIYSIK